MKRLLKEYRVFITIFAVLVLLLPVLAGCTSSPAPATSTTTPPAASTPVEETALTVVKEAQNKTYTMADLKAMPQTTGLSGDMSSTGKIEGPYQYKGVALTDILKLVGGITENNAVRVSAKDNYSMTLSYNQITTGAGFPTFDSKTGKEITPSGKVNVIIAYEQDGKPIEQSGPLRMALITDNLLTDGHWWEKWVIKIEVIGVEKPFSLNLQGAITQSDDKATIESCSTPGCHGETWTDTQGRIWKGIPLWWLVGSVDDTVGHGDGAFNDELADKGYEVHVLAADGFAAKFTSAEVKRNDNMIVAFQRDGAELPTNQWPLRLVGKDLPNQNMVGQITTIKIIFATGSSTTTPGTGGTGGGGGGGGTGGGGGATTSAPAGTTVVTVVMGGQTTNYSLADLQKFLPLTGYGGTKNKTGVVSGPFSYQGVPLLSLLTSAGGSSGGLTAGQSVKVTASDNFSKTMTYEDISNGNFTTYDSTGATVVPVPKPVVAIVYSIDGKLLDATAGPAQLGIICAQSLVSDGSNSVKMVQKIEVLSAK